MVNDTKQAQNDKIFLFSRDVHDKWQGTGSLWCKMAFSCVLPRGHRSLPGQLQHTPFLLHSHRDGCSSLCHLSFVLNLWVQLWHDNKCCLTSVLPNNTIPFPLYDTWADHSAPDYYNLHLFSPTRSLYLTKTINTINHKCNYIVIT